MLLLNVYYLPLTFQEYLKESFQVYISKGILEILGVFQALFFFLLFVFPSFMECMVLVDCAFCSQESLAFMFEMAHLHEDALREYDELELCYLETGSKA